MTATPAESSRSSILPMSAILSPGAFRLALASAVVVSHMSRFDIGRLAVLLFFFLSGYWTSRIWAEKFGGQRWGKFYLSRYWRIAPLFFISTIISAISLRFPLRIENFTLLGIGASRNDPTGVSWSLDVELQFYLLLPLIAAALSRRSLLVLCVSAALAVLGWWIHLRFEVATVAKFLPIFLLGGLTYMKAWRPGPRTAYLSLAAFLAFTIFTSFTPFLMNKDVDPFDRDIWAFLWMLPLLPYVAHSLTLRSSKLDRHLGNLSFPLYLVHYPVIALVTAAMGQGLLTKVTAIVVMCLITLLVYFLLDRPIDALRIRVTERDDRGGQRWRLNKHKA
jgi:peptidoglycan/LPS O-acetylase OafA/YrhL